MTALHEPAGISVCVLSWMIVLALCLIQLGSTRREENLALHKPAYSSKPTKGFSSYKFKPEYLVDGHLGSSITSGDKCLESGQPGQISWVWWMVDLQKIQTIRSVGFTARSDCCYERGRNLTVEVTTENPKTMKGFPGRTNASVCMTRLTTLPPFLENFILQCDTPVTGRFVRIVKYEIISLCEIAVYEHARGVKEPSTNRKNLAINKPTAIDSNDFTSNDLKPSLGSPGMAVDGDREGYMGHKQPCFVKRASTVSFLVDLEDIFVVDAIYITNEVVKYGKFLRNFSIEVSVKSPITLEGFPNATNSPVCHRQVDPVPIGYTVVYNCRQPIVGRYVRLVSFAENPDPLHLCEFEVYGEPLKVVKSSARVSRFEFIKDKGSLNRLNSISGIRFIHSCARQHIKEDDNPARFSLTDLHTGSCYFLTNATDSKYLSGVSDWAIYEIGH